MYITRPARSRLYKRLPAMIAGLVRLGCATGLRISELLALEWTMADPRKPGLDRLIIPAELMKGKARARVVNIPIDVQDALRKLPEQQSERIFPISRSTASKLIKRHAGIRTHDMRRIFATDTYHALRDIILTSVVMGHQDYRNTLRYIHNMGSASLWQKVHRYQAQKASSNSAASGNTRTRTARTSPAAQATSATTYSRTKNAKTTNNPNSKSASGSANQKKQPMNSLRAKNRTSAPTRKQAK